MIFEFRLFSEFAITEYTERDGTCAAHDFSIYLNAVTSRHNVQVTSTSLNNIVLTSSSHCDVHVRNTKIKSIINKKAVESVLHAQLCNTHVKRAHTEVNSLVIGSFVLQLSCVYVLDACHTIEI